MILNIIWLSLLKFYLTFLYLFVMNEFSLKCLLTLFLFDFGIKVLEASKVDEFYSFFLFELFE